MSMFLLLTIALALILVPIWASRDPSPRRGLKKTVVGIVAFGLVYLFLVRVVVPRLS